MIRVTTIGAVLIATAVAAILLAAPAVQRSAGGPETPAPNRDAHASQKLSTPPRVSAESPTPDDPEEQKRERQRQKAIEEKNPELLPVCTQEQLDNHPEVTRPSPESVWDAVDCKAPPPKPEQIHRGPRSGPGWTPFDGQP